MEKVRKGKYLVGKCGVCDIDDIIGSNEDLCALHYSPPNVKYHYGYEYITAVADRCIYGYYIGIDRFCQIDGVWAKEYMLYEYAIYIGEEASEVNEALFSYLVEQAQALGCSRIVCENEGGNSLFNEYFAEHGFVEGCLQLSGVQLPARDEILLPSAGDKVTFEQAFFLREQDFIVDREKIRFEWGEEEISICRRTGECSFSKAFEVVGETPLILNNQRALSLIDICCQILPLGEKSGIKIYSFPSNVATAPDVLVDKWGIFVVEQPKTMWESREFLAALKKEGVLEKVTFYAFRFDSEVGGREFKLHYIPLKK